MPNEVLLFGPSSSIRRLNMAIVQKSSTSKVTRILPSQRYNRYSLIDSAACSGNEWRFSSVRQLKTMSKQRFAPLTNTRNIRLFISKKVHRSAFVRAIHSFVFGVRRVLGRTGFSTHGHLFSLQRVSQDVNKKPVWYF